MVIPIHMSLCRLLRVALVTAQDVWSRRTSKCDALCVEGVVVMAAATEAAGCDGLAPRTFRRRRDLMLATERPVIH